MRSPPANPFLLAADLFDPPRDEDYELAVRCAEHLPTLIREAWPLVEPATPLVWGFHLDVICEHLQAVSDGDLLRLIINIPPRSTKSLTTAVFWHAWEWLRRPWLRWIGASYASSLAERDAARARRLILSEGGRQDGTIFQRIGYQGVLRLINPEPWGLAVDQNAKTRYETTEAGLRLATSIRGIATGEGGDRLVVDDPTNATQARSDAERVKANEWWDGTMTTRFNNADAAAVIVMQRLHEQDLTGHLLEQGGWHHLCLPAEYSPSHPFVCPPNVVLPDRQVDAVDEDGEPCVKTIEGGRELAGDPRTEPGQLLEPVRLGRTRLAELLKGLGSYGYAGQIKQLPAPDEGGMFRRGWWRYWTPETLPHTWQQVIASWDMDFGSQAAGSSYVVGQVWGVDGADRYLLGQIRARFSFTDSLKAVQALADWRPDAAAKLVERKANGAAVIDTLKGKIGGLIAIEPEGGKDVRAAAVEPSVEAGNVYLPASDFIPCPAGFEATSVTDWIEEAAIFPNGAHDDQVDAMTQALNWLENKRGETTTVAYMPDGRPTVVRRGDLTLVGDRYIDKE